jgi:hypothetical protein
MYEGLGITVYVHSVYDRLLGDFLAEQTVSTPYIYG